MFISIISRDFLPPAKEFEELLTIDEPRVNDQRQKKISAFSNFVTGMKFTSIDKKRISEQNYVYVANVKSKALEFSLEVIVDAQVLEQILMRFTVYLRAVLSTSSLINQRLQHYSQSLILPFLYFRRDRKTDLRSWISTAILVTSEIVTPSKLHPGSNDSSTPRTPLRYSAVQYHFKSLSSFC